MDGVRAPAALPEAIRAALPERLEPAVEGPDGPLDHRGDPVDAPLGGGVDGHDLAGMPPVLLLLAALPGRSTVTLLIAASVVSRECLRLYA